MSNSADHIKLALARRFGGRSWMNSTEVEIAYDIDRRRYSRRFDFVAANVCAGDGFIVVGVEVKISRQDFLNEQKDLTKFETMRNMTHVAYYATPKGLLKKIELPSGAGLLEIQPDGRLRELVKPVRNDTADTALVLAGMLRRSYAPSMRATLAAICDEFRLPRKDLSGSQDPKWWTDRLRRAQKKGSL